MFRRGLAFGMTLMIASVVQAGATITLVPSVSGPYPEGVNTNLNVEIRLTWDGAGGGAGSALRFIQLDLSNSSADLFPCAGDGCISPPTTHSQACPNGTPGGGTIRLWDFASTPLCGSDSTSCGCGHFLEQVLNGARPNVVSSTYYFTNPANLGENTNAQRVLPSEASLLIGKLFVVTPKTAGTYTLDVMNAGETNADLGGADVRFGFGVNINGEPLTTWRAGSGLTGGTLDLVVGAGGGCPNLVSATPACGSSLPRSAGNVIRVAYDGAITDPTGCAGVEVVEVDAGGADIGGNLAPAGFSCSADGPNTLRLGETGATLSNAAWYRVTFCGETVIYRSLKGDANNDGLNDFGDLSFIFANSGAAIGDADPNDINADGFVDFGDLSAAFSFAGTPSAPAGPPCP